MPAFAYLGFMTIRRFKKDGRALTHDLSGVSATYLHAFVRTGESCGDRMVVEASPSEVAALGGEGDQIPAPRCSGFCTPLTITVRA